MLLSNILLVIIVTLNVQGNDVYGGFFVYHLNEGSPLVAVGMVVSLRVFINLSKVQYCLSNEPCIVCPDRPQFFHNSELQHKLYIPWSRLKRGFVGRN